ncbi:restriction endonuclease subunit S [Microbacterium sp. bgisy207]|uniref:restriction endonuclease subunit S n=1 Tax=Microbacterium sp. bgisy207 TaxID=3413800 RepID=UPI003EB753D3
MSWETVPLGDVAELNPRTPYGEETGTFLGMTDLGEDGRTTSGIIVDSQDLKTGYTPFRNADLLVAKITPCFENGKIGQVRIKTDVGWGSTEFHVVRPNDAMVDRRFLHHFLRTPEVRAAGGMRMTGSAGQRRVPINFLRRLQIPLPPLPEQRRIAAILDEPMPSARPDVSRFGCCTSFPGGS